MNRFIIRAQSQRLDRPTSQQPPQMPRVAPQEAAQEPYVVHSVRVHPGVKKLARGAAYTLGGLFVLGMIGSACESQTAPPVKRSSAPDTVTRQVPQTVHEDKPTSSPWAGLPPCEHEDGPGPCYWDASTRENGQGLSFIIERDGTVRFLDDTGAPTEAPTKPVEQSPGKAPRLGLIPSGRECVLQTINPHKTHAIVADTDPMCGRWWKDGPTTPPTTAPFDPIAEWEAR